ncbi:MAG: glutamyl-tRNA(Gln) and/or aspartyl-tRNA(Asn) amidotransferase subunit B [Candidatus Berkelbacteria bacterium Licking1014_7]|uniref:Aspartyl/glutamyl-tRNA(Asn/Gln) amidotransferase subunit B n=1 Tax=Candidatus Berkelbacteria bacterium Licking1014_7 TaxID=2017147 RepID=A0A554LIA0_9BACT|nr:MAG: glutamyl-tRNA(Gln) and/or aspartyl-tRNA(Asn) amidotransferase subunit B [Candidatus Berkelbacteria bacterium Licking1014_7]
MKNKYEPIIGLEIHAELNTKSKMFCGCKNDPFGSAPNTNVCPVCLGLPGTLPAPNKQAILDTIKIGKALNSKIAVKTKWDRKHYFYPDLPKNYQISQYDQPICEGGYLNLPPHSESPAIHSGDECGNKKSSIHKAPCFNAGCEGLPNGKKIVLTRIHLEEDTGKLLHSAGDKSSFIDLNRAGAPLVELVTEPVIISAKQAGEFCREYQLILRYLGVSNADMEKGEMRAEVNISLRKSEIRNPKSETNSNNRNPKLGTKVEVKNLNSFKAVEKAIEYEIKRQSEILDSGGKVAQETRGWNDSKQKTFSQRIKETSADYRYFPEPDIPPIATKVLEKEIGKLPELPDAKRDKYKKWGLEDKDIEVIIANLKMSDYFEQTAYNTNNKKILANLLINEVSDMRLKPNDLAYMANVIDSGGINRTIAKKILEEARQGKSIESLFKKYQKIDSGTDLNKIVKKAIAQNPDVAAKIKAGKTQAIAYLIGQVMRETRGKADAKKVEEKIAHFLFSIY